MLTATERLDAFVGIVKGHCEMPTVLSGRLEPETRGSKETGLDQCGRVEPDQWWLLRKLVDRDVTGGDDRDPVDRVVADCVAAEYGASARRRG